MENSSLSIDDVRNDVTTSLPLQPGDPKKFVFNIIYSIIGSVGLVDNLLVLIIFGLFIKITNKVI